MCAFFDPSLASTTRTSSFPFGSATKLASNEPSPSDLALTVRVAASSVGSLIVTLIAEFSAKPPPCSDTVLEAW